MIFVDGTNLFYRLEASQLRLRVISPILREVAGGRQIIRTYLYTTEPHLTKARQTHKSRLFDDLRVVLGDAVQTSDGNFKEKGVDARLVADFVYHAASKNYDFGILVSVDTDFAHALKRVEDFECRTAAVGICATVPDLLKAAADEVYEFQESSMVSNNWAERV